MSAKIYNVGSVFACHAGNLCNKKVHVVVNIHDYVFLKISNPNKRSEKEWIAVPLDKYPDIQFESGDMVRYTMTSQLVAPMSGEKPCAIVARIERLDGQIIDLANRRRAAARTRPQNRLAKQQSLVR